MPDIGGNGGVDTSLYPHAPASGGGGIGSLNPLQAIGFANGALQTQALQRELASRQAIGQAYQGAMNPDGSVDQTKLSSALQADPAAAYGLPEATTRSLAQRSGQMDLDAKQQQLLIDTFGSLANDPNLNKETLRHVAVTMARNLKIPGSMLNDWIDQAPNDRKGLRAWAIEKRNIAIGSAGLSTPTPTGITPEGAPITSPRDVYNYRTAGGGLPASLAPGEQGLSELAAGRAANLQATASTSPQYHADLENLRQDSSVMGNLGGPTQEVEKKLNQLSTRIGGFGITMSPDQLRSSESFDKIANQIALNQAKMLGGTDTTRSMTVGATPNSGMSRYGRDGVIDMLQGNQDSVDATRDAWLNARANGASAGSHDLFMNHISKVLDPRVFQFNRLSRDNQQKFLSQMAPEDVPAFEYKYAELVKRGWVRPLKAAAQ